MRRPGHWPSPTALWLLRVALWDGDRAARAWRHVVKTTEIETIDPAAARLLPLAVHNARRLGLQEAWSGRAQGVYRYWWAHNQLLVRRCAEAVSQLATAGIPNVLLKGVPLGLVYYDNPGLRPMRDFDVLVRREDVFSTLGILGRLGWAPERRVDRASLLLLHGASLHDRGGRTLDLHWAIHEEDVRPGADDDAWASARAFDVSGVPAKMLAPAPLLVHALAGGAKWAADPAVQWVADAVLIARRGDVDWDAVVMEAIRRRFVVRVRACLTYLRVALEAPIPASVVARLDVSPVSLFERAEHQVRTRTHPRLGELPRHWFAWSRTAPDAWRDPIGFAGYLRCTWDLPSMARVPIAAASRAGWRLATGRARPPPG